MTNDFNCYQPQPFDLRRERRYHYRMWKRHPTSKKDKRASGVMQSVRQFHKVMQAQYEAYLLEDYSDLL